MNELIKEDIVFDFSNKTILLVEDIFSNYKFLEALLKPTKAKIIWAKTGSDAIELLKNHNEINIVLMDIQLPDMGGCEITRIIKNLRKDLPVIAQTAYAMATDEQRCMEAGCDDFVTKPILGSSFISLIAKYLK